MRPLAGSMTQQTQAWLEQHLQSHPADCQALASFLAGASLTGYQYPPEHYGCLLLTQPVSSLPACLTSLRNWLASTGEF